MTKLHVYSGNPLDRGERERRNEEWVRVKAKDPTSKYLPMFDLKALLSQGARKSLGWLEPDEVSRMRIDREPAFLGLLNGTAHFVVDITNRDDAVHALEASCERKFEDARSAAAQLSRTDVGIVAQAKAQVDWHRRHGFCSACGNETVVAKGGLVRKCPRCETEHFPRTDPVVITVVSDKDRCLLGQSSGRQWASKMYSALAGFVDQGESIEEAVGREIMEEAGIRVGNVRYHSSQPWPFPYSLMIGCHADAVTTDISKDDVEMKGLAVVQP